MTYWLYIMVPIINKNIFADLIKKNIYNTIYSTFFIKYSNSTIFNLLYIHIFSHILLGATIPPNCSFSSIRVPSRRVRQVTQQSHWSPQLTHQTRERQFGIPRLWLAVQHLAPLPPTRPAANQSSRKGWLIAYCWIFFWMHRRLKNSH